MTPPQVALILINNECQIYILADLAAIMYQTYKIYPHTAANKYPETF